METPKNVHKEETHADNNIGTVGRVTKAEHDGIVISEHHTPNTTGHAENDEDHRVDFAATRADENDEPRDSISDGNKP